MTTPPRRPGPAAAGGPSRAGLLAAAVADNVAWCSSVARAQGIPVNSRAPGRVAPGAADDVLAPGTWATTRPMPALFPSAVTTRPGVPAEEVLAALPPGPVAVKDAFADVDLSAGGFTELLRGRWLVASSVAPPRAGLRVVRVRTPGQRVGFAAASAHRDLDWAALQADPTVDLVLVEGFGARGWEPRARAVVSSGSAAVGVSNVQLEDDVELGDDGTPAGDAPVADVWRALAAFAARRFPGRPVVGWEPEADVAGPVAAGLVVAGPLRVWVRG